jgi:hypothetical protein
LSAKISKEELKEKLEEIYPSLKKLQEKYLKRG